jgi:diguanylate cyclase (GGDEF)-like protein
MNQARSHGVEHLLLAVVPGAAVLMAFLASLASPALAPRGAFPAPWELIGWALLAALAALHRPFERAGAGPALPGTLGLGAVVLLPVLVRHGATPAASIAFLALLLSEIGRYGLARASGASAPALPTLLQVLERAMWTLAALLASAFAAGALAGGGWALTPAAFLAAVGYAVVVGAGVLALERLRGLFGSWRELLPALALDLAGFALGGVLAQLAHASSWRLAFWPLAVLALVAADAARQASLRVHADRKVDHLERLHLAHERILGEISGMGGIAQQILTECRNVLPVEWFEFEQLDPQGGQGPTWAAGPDGEVVEGRPRPPLRPSMLPGVHKRAEWKIIERYLDPPRGERGGPLARVRLWCDPRRMEPDAERLFASLLPQMSSSVQRAQLDREAKLDPLTGVPVRRLLDSRLQGAYLRSCEEGAPMAVILCDIDFFKKVNDTWGHAAGDAALQIVARTLDSQRRDDDLCCRYGGEEFAVLLEETGGDDALRLAERLRRAVAALEFSYEGEHIPLTMSYGVAAFPDLHIKTGSELLVLADEALYEAKHRGRNLCLLHCGHGTYRAPTSEM